MIRLALLSDQRTWRSLSPRIHRAALSAASLSGNYLAFEVAPEHLGQAVDGLWALGFQGANVTVPHKEAVIPFLAGLSNQARAIGAVNTLVRGAGGFWGHNTDAPGFLAALGDRPPGPALVFGTGGAARATLAALASAGIETGLCGRDSEKAARLAEKFKARPVALESLAASGLWPLVANCSSASSDQELGDALPWLRELNLSEKALVTDLNYGREQNSWAELAAAKGAAFVDGLPMLAQQARLSFELWTGLSLPVDHFTIQPGAVQ